MKTETNNIKLSDKQKEVIRLMREGWYPETSVFFYKQVTLEHIENGTKRLNWKTFQKLLEDKLICCASHDYAQIKQYYLTETMAVK